MSNELSFTYCILIMIMKDLQLYFLLSTLHMHTLTLSLVLIKKNPPGPHNDHDQVNEPHKAKADVSSPVLGPMSPKAQHRYIPLKLPQTLHDFPPNYYEYLPVLTENRISFPLKNTIKGLRILYIYLILTMMMCV